MKVLVIDDDPAVAEGLRDAFAARRLPPEIEVAEGAADGLRRLRGQPEAHDVVIADPASLPGRLAQAVAELRAAAPQAAFLALLDARSRLEPEQAAKAGFDDAFVKHARVYPVLGRLVLELVERQALTRQQLRLGQARADAEQLLTAVMTVSDAGVAVLDAGANVAVANGQFCRLAGGTLGDVVGRPLWPRLALEDAGMLRDVLAAPEAGSGSIPLRLTLMRPVQGALATDARVLVRELGPGQRSVVLALRPVAGEAAAATGWRVAEPVLEPSSEGLRAALRARVTPPVIVRLRPAASARSLARNGAAPPELAAVLRLALREALLALLAEGDIVFTAGEDTHVLLGEGSTLAAMRRLGGTLPALREGLLRSPRLARDLLAIGGARLVEQLPELSELQVTAAPVDLTADDVGREDLAGLLAGRLQAEEAVLGGETLHALSELRMHATCELAMVQDQDGAPSALCLPCLDEEAAAAFAALAEQAPAHPELALHLALLMLELTAEALAEELDRESALAVVDLHFAVLGQRRLAERFLDRCRTLPPELTRTLVVNLLGVPAGAYAPKFARVTSALVELFRLRALTMRDLRAELVDLDLARISLIIIDYRDLEPFLDERRDLVQALVRRAHRGHARLLVRRVPRGTAAELRDELGVDLTSSG